MNKMMVWNKAIALLVLGLSTTGTLEGTATVVTNIPSSKVTLELESTPSHRSSNVQLAQGLVGQCRAATRSMFVYRERSTSNPIRALEVNEAVTLAQVEGRDGWIAISSPISGFVETKDLKVCSEGSNSNQVSAPPPIRTSPSRTPNRSPSRSSSSNLCRQITYDGPEGVAIRQQPDKDAPRVGGVFLEQRVTLTNPPQFRQDSEGRQWIKLSAPVAGWISNGFPSTGGTNVQACSE
ncbi:MAG TPA: SH3 domain-containing protein [Coleofasciculaceae cyanobacterium]